MTTAASGAAARTSQNTRSVRSIRSTPTIRTTRAGAVALGSPKPRALPSGARVPSGPPKRCDRTCSGRTAPGPNPLPLSLPSAPGPNRDVQRRLARKARRPQRRGSSPRPLRRRRRAASHASSRSAMRRNSGPRTSQSSNGASRSPSSLIRRARPWFSTVGRVSFPSLSSSGARAVRPQLGLSAVLIPCALAAQTPAAVQRAANLITAEGVRHHIGVLADDSMLGRATPSPQLEQVAQYVAAQFRRFGLKPAGDTGYLQRYTVTQRVVDTQVSVIRITGAAPATLKPGSDVYLLRFTPLPTRELSGPVVLFTGTPDSANPLAGADVRGAGAALIATATPQGVQITPEWVRAVLRAGAIGWMVISNRPDAQWQNRLARTTAPTRTLEGIPSDTEPAAGAFEIRDTTAAATLGIDPAALRAGTGRWTARRLPATVTYLVKERELARASAPNVIGVLEGSDPKLKSEYVFFTGHMDHIGTPGAGEGCVAKE